MSVGSINNMTDVRMVKYEYPNNLSADITNICCHAWVRKTWWENTSSHEYTMRVSTWCSKCKCKGS
jgi:hypothetical protein